jgi:ABC-type dipeptide/oligopeptide/nickel transport system permease subunit
MTSAQRRALLRDPRAITGIVLVAAICLIALLAPILAPHDPIRQYNAGLTADGLPIGPSPLFPIGTDDLGRDILSRLMYGARVSLEVGLFANLIAVAVGAVLGITAGYFGQWVETAVMRFTDFMMAFPFLLFVMALVTVLQPSITNIFIAIASIGWITTARVLRAETLVLRRAEFVTAARALGCSSRRVMFAHILPNLIGKLAVLASLGIAFTILLEAGLSYLGIGVPPPTPSWGSMLREGQDYYTVAPILIIAPGICIVVTVIGFNLLAEGVDRVLDPRRNLRSARSISVADEPAAVPGAPERVDQGQRTPVSTSMLRGHGGDSSHAGVATIDEEENT